MVAPVSPRAYFLGYMGLAGKTKATLHNPRAPSALPRLTQHHPISLQQRHQALPRGHPSPMGAQRSFPSEDLVCVQMHTLFTSDTPKSEIVFFTQRGIFSSSANTHCQTQRLLR